MKIKINKQKTNKDKRKQKIHKKENRAERATCKQDTALAHDWFNTILVNQNFSNI